MQKSIVYMRNIQWDVVVPIGLEWDFMKAFGEAFCFNDPTEGTHLIRPVDNYREHPGGWRIKITINEAEEPRLEQFCKEFFGSRDISFRGPGIQELSCDEIDPFTVLAGMESRQVSLDQSLGSTVIGTFLGFEGPCAVIRSGDSVLPYRLDRIKKVTFLSTA